MDVTCIVAAKNAERFLGAALQSVREQSGTDVELIVVDGASVDRTRAIASSFGARIVEDPGAGLAQAWNMGIRQATCPEIAFLDSDDLWAMDTLAARLGDLRDSGAGVSIGRVRHFLDAGRPVSDGISRDLLEEAGRVAPIPGAMLVRRDVFDAIGLFDPAFSLAADADWLGRLIDSRFVARIFDRVVLLKRLHGDNLTRQVERLHRELLSALKQKMTRRRDADKSGMAPAGEHDAQNT